MTGIKLLKDTKNYMNNYKVLHIIDSLGLGGAQTILKGIFEAQTENNAIFIYSLRKKDITISILHPNVFIYDSFKKYSFGSLYQLKKMVEIEKIDILHCHLFKSQVFGLLLKTIWFRNIKLEFHEHGEIIENSTLYRWMLRFTQNKVSSFIAVSKAMKDFLIKKAKIKEGKITVLYNFVDVNKFNRENINWDIDEEKNKLNIKKDEFVVGFSGRLITRKGWKEFIEAASEILEKQNKIKFLIVGDGPDRLKMLKLIESYKLKDKIYYLGYTSDMLLFYSLIDCFVLPSYWEGLAMTQLEVLAMGIPLISSDGIGMNEIGIDNESCLYTRIGDKSDISEKILRVFSDIGLKEKLINNSKNTIKQYTLPTFLEGLNDIYKM